MAAIDRISAAMDAKDEHFFKALGGRLKAARKAQGLTQVQLSEQLGIAQQTLAHYEVGRARVPVSHLLAMARLLGFSIDDMLMGPERRSKRGPVSRLEEKMEAVSRLPRSKQRLVADMLDAILAQQQSV